MLDVMELLQSLGLSEKSGKIYLAALENGESSVSFLAEKSKIKRTTVYEFLEEMIEQGTLVKTLVGKKNLYSAVPPRQLLALKRRMLHNAEDEIEHLEAKQFSAFDTPKVKFFYGPNGFKTIWQEIFKTTKKEYKIITNAEIFSKYISDSYLHDEIINQKKKREILSKQLVTNSSLAKRIIKKDKDEGRKTRILPPDTQLEFTEVITDSITAFISEPEHAFQFIIENKAFAHFRRQMFDAMWDSLE